MRSKREIVNRIGSILCGLWLAGLIAPDERNIIGQIAVATSNVSLIDVWYFGVIISTVIGFMLCFMGHYLFTDSEKCISQPGLE